MLVDLRSVQQHYLNERDLEIPALCALVEKRKPGSLLDVGACWSWSHYAPRLRELVPIYDAVDILEDLQIKAIVDRYVQDNFLTSYWFDFDYPIYDFISCISTIEHAGLSTYQAEYKVERLLMFHKMLTLSNESVFLSFPFGQHGGALGQYMNITDVELGQWLGLAEQHGFCCQHVQFFYNEFSMGGNPWGELSREAASQVPVRLEKGCQCVALVDLWKQE